MRRKEHMKLGHQLNTSQQEDPETDQNYDGWME